MANLAIWISVIAIVLTVANAILSIKEDNEQEHDN